MSYILVYKWLKIIHDIAFLISTSFQNISEEAHTVNGRKSAGVTAPIQNTENMTLALCNTFSILDVSVRIK